jgi:DNA ligase-1
MKPMLATDYVEDKLVFPLVAQPKIDGVRCLNIDGQFTGRSLKGHKNRFITERFSHPLLAGLDGEAAAEHECHPDLCRLTSSALSTIEGEPYILWHLFDDFSAELVDRPYLHRLAMLQERYARLEGEVPHLWPHLRVVPHIVVANLDQLLEVDSTFLAQGYEGTIVRSIKGKHKQGRSTVREGGLLRIKRFVDFEFRVHTVIEGEENQNEATINALGLTERSTHQENMVANGMIGAMLGTTLSEVKDGDVVLFEKGAEVRVGAGCLTHVQRRYYFENQDEFKRLIHKAKFFPKGIKDKPRFPTWKTFRPETDVS